MTTKLETRLATLEEAEAAKQSRVPAIEITAEEASRIYHKFMSRPCEPSPEWDNLTPEQASWLYTERMRAGR